MILIAENKLREKSRQMVTIPSGHRSLKQNETELQNSSGKRTLQNNSKNFNRLKAEGLRGALPIPRSPVPSHPLQKRK